MVLFDDNTAPARGITRREFLKGTGVAIAGTALPDANLQAAALAREPVQSGAAFTAIAVAAPRDKNACKPAVFEALARRTILSALSRA